MISYLDSPRVRGRVQTGQHIQGDGLPIGQDLRQVLRPQDRPERGRREKLRALGVVSHVADGGKRGADLVVDDGVDGDGDGVLGENLLRGDVEGDGPEVGDGDLVHAGDDEEEAGADGAAATDAAEAEEDSALVLLMRGK